jgi:hypothetical protein
VRLAAIAAASSLLACAPTPIEVMPAPVVEPAPEPVVVRRPPQDLKVAGPAVTTTKRVVTVDARQPRTAIGRMPAGARVRISVLEARWSNDPGAPFHDASGDPGQRCGSPGHTCVGGDGAAPLMGLILMTAPADAPPVTEVRCAPQHRLYVPHGVEFAVPEETELALAPNDWEDGLDDNAGAIQVEVQVAASRGARAERRRIEVDARRARTPRGRFQAGQYVRVSVLGGRWKNAAAAALVDAAGVARSKCRGDGVHPCAGGEEAAPMMGLILLVGPCVTRAARPVTERRFIPDGAELVLARESDLFLGPNDWEDGCDNNRGAAIVEVESELP